METEIKLKLCPFCGDKAYVAETWNGTKAIKCCLCGCGTMHYKSELTAAEKWNQRASSGMNRKKEK